MSAVAPSSAESPFGVDLTWPAFGTVEDMRPAMRRLRDAGESIALATLYASDGPAPRGVGAQMVFGRGVVSGFFSGGCVEGDVARHAEAVLADGAPRRLVYGQGSPWLDIQLLCGGRIEILVERVGPDDPALAALLAAEDERRPAVWVTDGVRRSCQSPVETAEGVGTDTERVVRRYDPMLRLVVVGSDPTAMTIAELGARSGFETTLVRPGGPAHGPDLPGVRYSHACAAAALAEAGTDAWTAVAVATHDLDADGEALVAALPSAAAYVGVLGARSRIPERLGRLRAAGVTEADLARLRAPIGLPIGGKAPWAVAVSVVGEIMKELRGAGTP